MPAAGDTFRAYAAASHLYVILTTPTGADGRFAIVNLTTKQDRRGEDHSCVLHAGEHPFIVHDTVVRFSDAAMTDEAAFRAAFSTGGILLLEAITPELLKKIQEASLQSRFTPTKIKTAVRTELEKPEL